MLISTKPFRVLFTLQNKLSTRLFASTRQHFTRIMWREKSNKSAAGREERLPGVKV
jgi:hypothetical protein